VAVWTKEDLRNDILEHIGRKSMSQTATAVDAAKVDAAIDAAYDQLDGFGLVPYSYDVIPEWAQPLLRDYVEPEIKPYYGIAVSDQEKQIAQWIARGKMVEQLAISNPQLPSAPEYF